MIGAAPPTVEEEAEGRGNVTTFSLGISPPPVAPLMEEDEDEDTEAGGAKAGLEGVGFAAGIAPEGEGCKLLVLLPLSMVGANVSLLFFL